MLLCCRRPRVKEPRALSLKLSTNSIGTFGCSVPDVQDSPTLSPVENDTAKIGAFQLSRKEFDKLYPSRFGSPNSSANSSWWEAVGDTLASSKPSLEETAGLEERFYDANSDFTSE